MAIGKFVMAPAALLAPAEASAAAPEAEASVAAPEGQEAGVAAPEGPEPAEAADPDLPLYAPYLRMAKVTAVQTAGCVGETH